MKQEKEVLGVWWLPTNPDERWVGTLVLAPSKSPKLTVTTLKSAFQFVGKEDAPTVIHGLDQSGKQITLLFPSWPQSRGGMALSQVEFGAGYAIIGAQIADHTDFNVNSITFQLQYLYQWCGITGFVNDSQPRLHEIQIHYKRPDDRTFIVDSDLSIEIRAGYSLQNDMAKKTLEEDLHIEFVSKQGIGLSDYKRFLLAVRQLIHFATLKPIYPLTVTARKDGHGFTLGDRFHHQDIGVWSSIIREPVKSELYGDEWVFKFDDVRTDFGKFMAMWFQYLEKFEEALDCYSATIYHRLSDSIEHLSLTQALDAYHGIKFQSHKAQDFGEKLKELVETHKASLKGLVNDTGDFVTTVLHNRNYYTHHNPKWKADGRVLSSSKLCQLNEKLRLLFQMCVLSDIGISQDRFNRLRRQLASYMDIL
jgi:hypothetical protein